MTTTYGSDNVVRAHAKTAVKKKTRKYAVIGAGLATVLGAGAAYAAVQLFGYGNADVNASTVQSLTIDNFQTVSPLYPGATVGVKAAVHNGNNIPVKVTAVIIEQDGLNGKGVGCDAGSLHPQGVEGDYGTGIGHGWKTVLSSPVAIPPNGAAWVQIDNAVSQDSAATAMCGFTAKVAVTAQTGN